VMSREDVLEKDLQRRQIVFARVPCEIVMVKLSGSPLTGLEEVEQDQDILREERRQFAEEHNLLFTRYRSEGDTGLPVVENAHHVFITPALGKIWAKGFRFVGGYWHRRYDRTGREKAPVNVFVFQKTEDLDKLAQTRDSIPPKIREMLNYCAGWIHVWRNFDGVDTWNIGDACRAENAQQRADSQWDEVVVSLDIPDERPNTYEIIG